MDIEFLGHSSFRIKGNTATVVTDPYDSGMVGFKYPKVDADIVTISHDHGDHNKHDQVKDVKKVVNGPGEYEISDVSILGYQTFHDDSKGKDRGKNTVYVFEMDDMRLAHLGDLGHKLSENLMEDLGEIDILMIPVGGEYTIGPAKAAETVQTLEPKITIPMHYQMKGLKKETFKKLEGVDKFLNEAGLPNEKMDKFKIKQSQLGEDQKIVVLNKK